ncbi:Deoxycytidine triphosphate deaminase (dUMP-forming) [Yersinia phage fEV-1]|nr:Deoxycytidine triphosphate deaminase (dUMP-forming) [Yersinia phage fEV-1]
MYLNHNQIMQLVRYGHMLNSDNDCINPASLDVRLGQDVMIEVDQGGVVDYQSRQPLNMQKVRMGADGLIVHPGQFFLAHTIEVCNFPDDMGALFRIKSSMGRIGLEHMDAGWIDPGFHGSLTLEFKNMTQHHSIRVRPGDRIGQLVFIRGQAVEEHQSYRSNGNYNGHDTVAQIGYKR